MAFTTTQTVDNILLRNLNFRYNNNAPPSTFYTIFASGDGHTYWSNTVTDSNISTLSTSLDNVRSTLSTYTQNIQNQLVIQSTLLNSNFVADLSTSGSLASSIRNTNTNFNILSNAFTAFSYLTNIKLSNYDLYISTTVAEQISSAINNISSLNIFFEEVDVLSSTIQGGLSTLSTVISVSESTIYSTITDEYQYLISSSLSTTFNSLYNDIGVLSTTVIYTSDFGIYSTQQNSTNIGIFNYVNSSLSTVVKYSDSTLQAGLVSTISTLTSTLNSHENRIENLESLSTILENLTNTWISTYTYESISTNNSTINYFLNENSTNILSTQLTINRLSTSLFSTLVIQSTLNKYVSTSLVFINSTLMKLQRQYDLLSVSSILVNIWSSFYHLQEYTSTLIGIRYSTISEYELNIYRSTVAQNTSTSFGFYNEWVATQYASTLSTTIPSTILFMSSFISTLYSTSYFVLVSSLNSTVTRSGQVFNSTISGLYSSFISTNNGTVNSSILGFLSTPASQLISSISSSSRFIFSSFNTTINTNSTIFFSTLSSYSLTFDLLYDTTLSTNQIAVSTLSSVLYMNDIQLSNFESTFFVQLDYQSSIFGNTLYDWSNILNSSVVDAYSTVISNTIDLVSTTAGIVTISTVDSYNSFLSSLNIGVADIGVSTLYTFDTLLLNSTNTTQIMDIVQYRNFNVLIRDIADNGLYTLNYTRNNLSLLNFRRGIITLDIQTVGQQYSTFNGNLLFKTNTLGIPTTVWGNLQPFIGNADYIVQYEYTIQNSILYTNLLGVYPRLAISSFQFTLSTVTVYNTQTGSTIVDPSTFFRGQPIPVSWSNYSFFPYHQVGAPPFNPYIVIETGLSNDIIDTYGPYPFSQSSATIFAPYVSGNVDVVQPAFTNIYIVGYEVSTIRRNFTVIAPTFDIAQFRPSTLQGFSTGGFTFLGGYELVGITDLGNYPFYNTENTVYPTGPPFGSTGVTYFNMDFNFNNNRLFNNIVNRVGFNGSPLNNIFLSSGNSNVSYTYRELTSTKGYLDYIINIPNFFPDLLTYSTMGNRNFNIMLTNGSISTTVLNANLSSLNTASTIFEVFNTTISAPIVSTIIPNNFNDITQQPGCNFPSAKYASLFSNLSGLYKFVDPQDTGGIQSDGTATLGSIVFRPQSFVTSLNTSFFISDVDGGFWNFNGFCLYFPGTNPADNNDSTFKIAIGSNSLSNTIFNTHVSNIGIYGDPNRNYYNFKFARNISSFQIFNLNTNALIFDSGSNTWINNNSNIFINGSVRYPFTFMYSFDYTQLNYVNIFDTNDILQIRYSISTLQFASTNQMPFIGPVGGPFSNGFFADRAVYVETPAIGLSSRNEPISTILFYNLLSTNNALATFSTPINHQMTRGNRIDLKVTPGNGLQYIYTISTTSQSTVQVFRF